MFWGLGLNIDLCTNNGIVVNYACDREACIDKGWVSGKSRSSIFFLRSNHWIYICIPQYNVAHLTKVYEGKSNTRISFKSNIRDHHEDLKATAYKTLVRPQLEYASSVEPLHKLGNTTYWRSSACRIQLGQKRLQQNFKCNCFNPVSILYKYSGPVRVADEPITAHYGFMKSASWVVAVISVAKSRKTPNRPPFMYKIIHNFVAIPREKYLKAPQRHSRISHPWYTYRQTPTTSDYYKYFFFFARAIVHRSSRPASILYKSTAGRYRPVSYPDGPITARYWFIKNAYWDLFRWMLISTRQTVSQTTSHTDQSLSCF